MKFVQAPIKKRIGALIIDYIVMMLLDITFLFVMMTIEEQTHIPDWLGVLIVSIILVLNIFYLPICEALFHGKTLGKKATKIRVVRTDGSPASGVDCLQRFLLLPFDTVVTIGMGGLISIVLTDKNQRLGDLVAGTMVVTDSPQDLLYLNLMYNAASMLTPYEQQELHALNSMPVSLEASPIEYAEMYRGVETKIAQLRTHKANPELIQYAEYILGDLHVNMFQRAATSLADIAKFALRSIPRAVYESRWAILLSLAIAVIGSIIGIYSQDIDPDFFRDFIGVQYHDMTIENIEAGKPMAVYEDSRPWAMFFGIFWNNFMVAMNAYAMGLIVLFGPLFFLVQNFVMMGTFVAFFAQHGHLVDAMVTVHQHGILEMSSIIIACGAGIRLGTGWMFPGKLSRGKAFMRGARQSLLVFISVVPMLLIAALIESFVTRHTEWPFSLRAAILIVSSLIIVGYYVMLPILAKRD